MFVTVELLHGTLGKTEQKRVSVILHTIRYEDRGYKDVY
jgi:hypothetical protein